MVIGIDIRVLARGTRTGVEEYTLNLLKYLLKEDNSNQYKLFYNAYQKKQLNFDWLKLPQVELCDFKIPNRLFFLSARYFNKPKIDSLLNGLDLYFNPHFFVAPLNKDCLRVMTFHDLSFERWPEFFSYRKKLWQKLLMNPKKEAQKADRIIAISDSTRRDLIDLYNIEPNKIDVVYSGIDQRFQPLSGDFNLVRQKYKLPKKFILYLGTLEPRKNLVGLIKAFEKVKEKIPQYKLVIAGAKGWLYEDILKTAQRSKCFADIYIPGFVEEVDKPALYNLADLFVYPSFFEGFGFPPLEAMACGVPTIVSDSSSLPEAVGQAALMVNPWQIDDLAQAVEVVLKDKLLQEKMINMGLSQAQKFSWSKCAQQTLKVFENVKRK